jgi:methionyl-tRNA synthetase
VLRFHAVYWPAILLSAGLRLPDELRVHGYLTVEGKKIGKSAGNAVDPRGLVAEYGACALRYYLLRHIPPFKDADFSRERLISAHDGELADELGNLALRVLTLAQRSGVHGVERLELAELERPLEESARELLPELRRKFAEHELGSALARTWELVRETNRYLERVEPWRLAKQDSVEARRRLANTLAVALAALGVLGLALTPFVPALAERLRVAVGLDQDPATLDDTSLLAHAPRSLPRGPLAPLVPRIRPRR